MLTREQFRTQVFARDNNQCVICGKPSQDAHHIIERRLWDNGGYHIDNGASLCADCHMKAEQTIISCKEIRKAAGIKTILLPPHFYSDTRYDKWGNIILPDGRRLKGELFFDESVQKILKSCDLLDFFCKYVKYPRTYHLPWSKGFTKYDRIVKNTKQFEGFTMIISMLDLLTVWGMLLKAGLRIFIQKYLTTYLKVGECVEKMCSLNILSNIIT